MRPLQSTSLFNSLDLDSPHSVEARRLVRQILSAEPNSRRKVFMVTSATVQEGKSTTSALLSLAAANFGLRTLAIDGDAARPTLHGLLGVSPSLGFCEVLQGFLEWRNAVQRTGHPGLMVLASGSGQGPLAQIYRDAPFQRLIDDVRDAYDLVIVDAPPVLPVVEAVLMGAHVDGILAVVMAGKTPVHLVRRMRQVLKPIAHKVIGCIVNNATGSLPYYFNYNYYGYKPTRRRAPASPGAWSRAGAQQVRDWVR